ncbi:MAG: META domain-containing protein, partial [Bacteroidota bacterium]
ISGGIDLDGQMMTFKPLMRTKMACPKVMGFESKFITALTGNSFEYKLQGLLLFLVNEENQLVFQKED